MINFFSFEREERSIRDRQIAAATEVINSGVYISGLKLLEFEKSFAEYLSIEFCIGVGNGTDAIEIALKSLGANNQSRIGTVANSGPYASTSILAIGATPVFIDIDPETMNIDPMCVEAHLREIDFLVLTHLYGRPVDRLSWLIDLCHLNNVKVVEDCSQAHGAKVDGKATGTFGDAAAFSFYPTKNLGALGDAGAVVTNSAEVAEKARSLRQYGWKTKYNVEYSGGRNSRLDEIQAGFLTINLNQLDLNNKKRIDVANRYKTEICNEKIKLPNQSSDTSVYHLYVIQTENRSELVEYCHDNGVPTQIHFPLLDIDQQHHKVKYKDVKLVNSRLIADRILSIPCNPFLHASEVNHIIKVLNEW